jgi:hypothetical protein
MIAKAFLFFAVAPTLVSAAAVLPIGLDPGDQYRVIFVTSVAHDALSPNISDYDAFVNSAANAPGSALASLNATWTAIGSTESVSAKQHLGTFSEPIYRPDGVLVADGSAGLFFGVLVDPVVPVFSGHLQNPISITELGTVKATTFTAETCCVFTGTYADGSPVPYAALGRPGGDASVGVWNDVYDDWAYAEGIPSTGGNPPLHAFYGISSVLTEPNAPAPESGTLGLMLLSSAGLLAWRLVSHTQGLWAGREARATIKSAPDDTRAGS